MGVRDLFEMTVTAGDGAVLAHHTWTATHYTVSDDDDGQRCCAADVVETSPRRTAASRR